MYPPESESSLPTTVTQVFLSSPPITINDKQLPDKMTDNETLKAESVQDEAPQELVPRPSSTDTERPPSAQRVNQDAHDNPPSEHEEVLEDEESDPAVKIADFDWEELALRYHGDIRKCEGNEAELMQEWEELMNVISRTLIQV